jgi:hypothetical protein
MFFLPKDQIINRDLQLKGKAEKVFNDTTTFDDVIIMATNSSKERFKKAFFIPRHTTMGTKWSVNIRCRLAYGIIALMMIKNLGKRLTTQGRGKKKRKSI